MKTNRIPPWIPEYLNCCAIHFNQKPPNLKVKLLKRPGGSLQNNGALIAYKDGRRYLEINSKCRNTPFWRKIVIHEYVHFLMSEIDVYVKIDLCDFLISSTVKTKAKKTYQGYIESFVEMMVDASFPHIEATWRDNQK